MQRGVLTMGKDFFVGTAEIEITSDKDLPLAGSLDPRARRAEGVHDPLYVRTIVLESAGVKLAYVIFDLIGLSSKMMNPYIRKAALATGIPEDNIIWACSHTHSGPVSIESVYPGNQEEVIDFEWLHHVLDKFVLPERSIFKKNCCQGEQNARIQLRDISQQTDQIQRPERHQHLALIQCR